MALQRSCGSDLGSTPLETRNATTLPAPSPHGVALGRGDGPEQGGRTAGVRAVPASCRCVAAGGVTPGLGRAGGADADAHGGQEREAVRHGAAVPADAVPAHAQRALLHAAGRAAHVPARPGRWRNLLRGPLPQGGAPRLPRAAALALPLSPGLCPTPRPPGAHLPLHHPAQLAGDGLGGGVHTATLLTSLLHQSLSSRAGPAASGLARPPALRCPEPSGCLVAIAVLRLFARPSSQAQMLCSQDGISPSGPCSVTL